MNSQQTITTPKNMKNPDNSQTKHHRTHRENVSENLERERPERVDPSPLELVAAAIVEQTQTLENYLPTYKPALSAAPVIVPNIAVPFDRDSSVIDQAPEPETVLPNQVVWKLMSGTTVGQALASATQRIRSVDALTPQLDAQVILARLLGRDRSWLFAHHDDVPTDEELERYAELVSRRTNHEPVAYLVGCKEFYGLEFMVDERVLIPRPETELLVDAVMDHIDMRANDLPLGKRLRVADIGTGSGAIAIAVAVNSPDVDVYATDVSPDALEIARLNIKSLDKRCQVSLIEGDLLTPLANKIDMPRVNVIVANLPYITLGDYDDLQKDVRDYEPQLALTAGPEGLDTIHRLLEQAPDCLEPNGVILLEIGADQGQAVVSLAKELIPQASSIILRQDHNGRDRVVMIAM